MLNRFGAAILVLTLTLHAAYAAADKRVALVIGNGAYKNAVQLSNPAIDADAIAQALKTLGFDVVRGLDLDHNGMRGAVREFSGELEGADVALFFYAGHGMQVFGENYLIPVDADLEQESDLDFSAMRVDLVLRQMEREPRIKIAILDACRDNPFEKQLAHSMGNARSTKGLSRGLAKMSPAGGTLLAFATDPGDIALDGEGKHSPFTAALLRHLQTPGLEIGVMMTRVRGDVFRETKERQRPWTNTSLTGEFYLHSPPSVATDAPTPAAAPTPTPTAPAGATAADQQMELAVWQAAEKSGQRADYSEYLRLYPEGKFAGFAQNRIKALKQTDQKATPQTTQPQVAKPAATRSTDPAEQAENTLGLRREDRRQIQRRLTLLGYDTRGIDGLFGPASRRAIAAWQTNSGYASTSYLNAAQYRTLLTETKTTYRERPDVQPRVPPQVVVGPAPVPQHTIQYQYQRPIAGDWVQHRPPDVPQEQNWPQPGRDAGHAGEELNAVRDMMKILKQ